MIGIDPHKASHTATAIDGSERMLGKVRVTADRDQLERLLEWASCWPERAWAVEPKATRHNRRRWMIAGAILAVVSFFGPCLDKRGVLNHFSPIE